MTNIAKPRGPLAIFTKTTRDVVDAGRSILSKRFFKLPAKFGLPTLKFGEPPDRAGMQARAPS